MKKSLVLITAFIFLAIHTFAREAVYIEYKITSSSISGTSKTYYSNGDSRSEMSMKSDAMPTPFSSVTLILSNTPKTAYSLNDKNKTYTELDLSKATESDDEYDITVLGKETIGSYGCTHVKVVYKKSGHSSEMWLSKDVSGYGNYTSVKNKYIGGSKFFSALKDKGADGFPVRIVTASERGGQIQLDLVKAEKQNAEESLFSLDGYTKGGGMGTRPGFGGASPEEIQKMTPEERKAYIEKMKAQYQH